jgi:hypothetical protein
MGQPTLILAVDRPQVIGQLSKTLESDPDFAVVCQGQATFYRGLLDGALDGCPDLSGRRVDAAEAIFTDGRCWTVGQVGGIAIAFDVELHRGRFVVWDGAGEIRYWSDPVE